MELTTKTEEKIIIYVRIKSKDTCKFLHMAMILSKSVLIARKKWSVGLCMIGHGNPAFEKCYNRKRPSKKSTESHTMRYRKNRVINSRKKESDYRTIEHECYIIRII
jgi:hypothetical protein